MKTPRRHLQIQGDPSIRDFLFEQSRVTSAFDDNIDLVIATVKKLIIEHGIFHAQIHFSSGQVNLWLLNDPFNYRVVLREEVLSGQLFDVYPPTPYPEHARVPKDKIEPVLQRFKLLRGADPVVYLRAGSLNVINGTVGMNFSCDGSHYVDFEEFLSNDNYSPD